MSKKNILLLLFLGVLLFLINYSVSFNYISSVSDGTVITKSISIPVASIAGLVLLIISAVNAKELAKKTSNYLLIGSIASLVVVLLSFIGVIIPASFEDIVNAAKEVTNNPNSYDELNNFLSVIANNNALIGYSAFNLILGIVSQVIVLVTSGMFACELNTTCQGKYDTALVKSHYKKTAIFATISEIFVILIVLASIKLCGTIHLVEETQTAELDPAFSGYIALTIFSSLVSLVFGICALVFGIKYLIDLYRVRKNIEEGEPIEPQQDTPELN